MPPADTTTAPAGKTRPDGTTRVAANLLDDVAARLNARAEARYGGNRSMALNEDMMTHYTLLERARRDVLARLTGEELDLCQRALNGVFLQPSLAPYLHQEIAEGLTDAGIENATLREKLERFGLLERLALSEIIQDRRAAACQSGSGVPIA